MSSNEPHSKGSYCHGIMNSKTSITWLTLRVRVHVPGGHKLPDRVRVILKERGAIFYPFQRKLMSIPLYKACWRPLEGKLCYNEQAMAVPVEMGKLLKRAKKQVLALQLYCLHGRTVQHKALGGIARLLQQVCDGELLLALHYPGCPRHQQEVLTVPRGEGHDRKPGSPSPASPATVVTSASTTNRTTQRSLEQNKSSCILPLIPSPPSALTQSPAVSHAPPLVTDSPLPPLPRLAEEDRLDILQQRWLSDDVMDLAQEIVRRVRPETRGLYTPAGAFTMDPLDPADDTLFLQVINRSMPSSLASMSDYLRPAGTHWLLATNFGAERGCLRLYDSMFTSATPSTAKLTRHLLSRSARPRVTFPRVQQQQDSYSCGMYAIAFAFSIAVGEDPASRLFHRASMAPHLLECLEQGRLKPFPSCSVGDFQQGCGASVTTNVSHRDLCHNRSAEVIRKVNRGARPPPQQPASGCVQVKDCPKGVTSTPTEPSRSLPHRVLFLDSGSAFVELLREYDIKAAQEEAAAKRTSEEKAAAAAAVRELASIQLTGRHWLRQLHSLGAAAILLWASMLAVQRLCCHTRRYCPGERWWEWC